MNDTSHAAMEGHTTGGVNLPLGPLRHVGDGIFLQTKTAQGIAGAFVWMALFLTCQQVRNYYDYNSFHFYYNSCNYNSFY